MDRKSLPGIIRGGQRVLVIMDSASRARVLVAVLRRSVMFRRLVVFKSSRSRALGPYRV